MNIKAHNIRGVSLFCRAIMKDKGARLLLSHDEKQHCLA